MDRRDMLQRTVAALAPPGSLALWSKSFAAPPASSVRGSASPSLLTTRSSRARRVSSVLRPTSRARMRCRRHRGLNWDRWQSIHFRNDQSLWAGEHCPSRSGFSHGFNIKKPCAVHRRERPGQELGFDRNMSITAAAV